MNLKNYTSTVPAERTVTRIEEFLVAAGAVGIMKDYKAGKIQALCFRLDLPSGKPMAVRLPANEDAVFQFMRHQRKRFLSRADEERLHDQARRTAWRLMQDWVEVQVSLIRMQQADPAQVFLAYAWDGNRTFYEALRDGGFKMLTAAQQEEG